MKSHRRMKLSFDNSEILRELIDQVYFSHEKGKRNTYVKKSIKLSNDDTYYKILSDLDYDIKLSNDIIDGHMIFGMEENKEEKSISLYPISTYCIEKDGKYCFY